MSFSPLDQVRSLCYRREMSPHDYPYQPLPAMSVTVAAVEDHKDDQAWNASVKRLNEEIAQYNATVEPNPTPTGPPPGFVPSVPPVPGVDTKVPLSPEATQTRVFSLAAAMRTVGDSHPDPSARQLWYDRAAEFTESNQTGRRRILKDIGMGLAIIVGTPIVMTGAALAGTGGIIYGLGLLFKGLGGLMTCGVVH